jgi:hypothetical protein
MNALKISSGNAHVESVSVRKLERRVRQKGELSYAKRNDARRKSVRNMPLL